MSKPKVKKTTLTLSAAQKWEAMGGVWRFVMKLLLALGLLAGGGQAWLWLGWFYPASRAWVLEVQVPIQQDLRSIITRGIQTRLAQIEGELLQAETQKATAKAPADQAKWALQAEKLRGERAELKQQLGSGK